MITVFSGFNDRRSLWCISIEPQITADQSKERQRYRYYRYRLSHLSVLVR